MNINDVRLLNESIQNAGNDALKRRAMKTQENEFAQRMALETQLQDIQGKRYDSQAKHFQAMEDIASQKADATAAAANRTTYKWKSKGVEMTSHDLNDLKSHPADADETGKHSLTMSGITPQGATVSKTISIPTTLQGDEETKKWGAQQIADFNDSFGVVPKPQADKTTEFERNLQSLGLDEETKSLIRKKKAMKEAGVDETDISNLPENQGSIQKGFFKDTRTTPNPAGTKLTPEDLRLITAPQTGQFPLSQPAAPAAIAPPAAVAQPNEIPTIGTQEDYDALPPGAQYKDSKGNIATKKKRQ